MKILSVGRLDMETIIDPVRHSIFVEDTTWEQNKYEVNQTGENYEYTYTNN